MKKSYLKRLICLGAAALILCSALAVAAVTGSPYETLKSALFNGIDIKNGTIKIDASVTIDGEPLEQTGNMSETRYIGDDAQLTVSGDGSFSFNSDDYRVSKWYGFREDFEGQWYQAYGGGDSYRYGYYGGSSFTVASPMEDMSAAQRRFVELVADLLVGDLKNNISMYEKDGIRYITGTLTSAQIPELVDAALDLITSESTANIDEDDYGRYSDDDLPPPKKLKLTYVHGDAQVDKDGNLIALSGEATLTYVDIFDRERELAVSAGIEITDIGATAPECPVSGVKELLDEYKQDDASYSNVRFKLGEDGTIDRDSVFDLMNKN